MSRNDNTHPIATFRQMLSATDNTETYQYCTNMISGTLRFVLFIVTCLSIDMDENDILKDLDEQLTEVLANPEQSNGDCVIKDLNHFMSVTDLMTKKLRSGNVKAVDCAKAMYIYGKPRFLDKRFKVIKMARKYKWTKKEVNLFLYLIRACFYHWINFKKNYVEYKLSPNISVTTLGPSDVL